MVACRMVCAGAALLSMTAARAAAKPDAPACMKVVLMCAFLP